MSIKEKYDKKLLVEGKDDQHVVWSLCEKNELSENFDVIDCVGIDKLLSQIPVRFKQSGIQTLGILVDADTNITTIWESLKNSLILLGFNLPEKMPKNGLIAENSKKQKLGLCIMPNNKTVGMLEDFIAYLIPQNDRLLPKANQILTEIEGENLHSYSQVHKSKALIHTWLAWQETPGMPMELAITKKYLHPDEQNCTLFVLWLRNLFK